MAKGRPNLMLLKHCTRGNFASILQKALSAYFDEEADQSVQQANDGVRTVVHDDVMAQKDKLTEIIQSLNVHFESSRIRRAVVRTDRESWLYDSTTRLRAAT